ncbi:DsbA family protein [Acetobacteraceae bacterium]|nr:DsbA family protein [Acetobacteraceae bacterium]
MNPFSKSSLLKTASCFALLSGIALTSFSAANAAAPSSKETAAEQVFSQKQRTAIIEIVRNALKKDPSILTDALMSLRQKADEENSTAVTQSIQKNWALFLKATPQSIWGNKDAKKTLTAFLDPRCGYCKRMVPVLADYIKAHPDVRLIERQVPLLGDASQYAVKAIFAAEQQGKYKEMRDLIMKASTVDEAQIDKFATQLKLDQKRFHADFSSKKVTEEMNQNIHLSRLARMEGTPYFLFGQLPVPGGLSLKEMNDLTKELPTDPS